MTTEPKRRRSRRPAAPEKEPAVEDPRGDAPMRRCTSHNRHGDPCGLPPIKGGTVCNKHGGSAPQVKNAARRRLNALAEPAVVVLQDILANEKVPPRDRIRAALGVLDRTGHGPSAKVEMEERPWERLLRESMEDFVRNPEAYPDEYAEMPHYERHRYTVYRGEDPEDDADE